MFFVEIYKLKNDGSQEVVVICKLIDEKVKCEGSESFIKNLEEKGILDYSGSTDKNLFFKDGLLFLQQLKNNFKSGYLNASEVKKK